MSYLSAQIAQLIQCSKAQAEIEPYYEVLQKITLTGVEYFDLGYKVSDFEIGDTIRFEGIVKGTDASSIPSSGSQLMLSIGNDGGQWLGKAQNGTKYAFGSSNVSTINFNEEVLADVTIALSGSASRPTFTISGSVTSDTATSTITQRSATPTYYNFPLLFGAGTKSTGEKAYGGDYTIKCGKIYINGTMTKDYIPVLDSQIRPCLYDRVSKTFLYAKKISDGTDATSTLTYQRWNKFDVDYIQSSGTQYIDTGYIPDTTTEVSMTFNIVNKLSASYPAPFYCGDTYNASNTYGISYNSSVGCLNCYRGTKVNIHTSNNSIALGTIYNVTLSSSELTLTTGTTSETVNMSGTYTKGDKTLYLFRGNTATTDLTGIADIQIYACQIKENGSIKRSYKPTVWHNGNTTAVACMYDEVYNKMYQNAGTGSFKAYILQETTAYTLNDGVQNDDYYLAENGTKTVSADHTSCYSDAISVKQGDIIEWTVTAEQVSANKRIHGYTTNADIEVGTTGSWVQMLAKIVFSTTSDTTQKAVFTIPSGINYIRVSHANVRESVCTVKKIRTYEVGKSVSNGQGAGYDLSVPYSNNFVFEAITTCKTTGSNYFMDTRKVISGSSTSYQSDTGAFGIGGSSSGSTINWKDGTGDNVVVATNGTNWSRIQSSLPFRYSAKLVGWDEGGNHKRTAVLYHFGSDKNSDRVVTNGANVANNRATVTLLYTTSSNVLGSGSDLSYIYFAQDGVVEYDVIPIRNATVTTDIGMFNRATNKILPRLTITGSPSITFNALD